MSMDSKKRKDFSNIVKLVVLCVIVILAVFLFRTWYLNSKELERNTPVLSNVLTHQIKANELYDYIHDANTAVVYMCASSDEECRGLEKEMKSLIRKNSLEDVIIYLDLQDVSDLSEFYDEMGKHYQYDLKIREYPTMIYFENVQIQEVLGGKDMDIKRIEDFLKGIQLIA